MREHPDGFHAVRPGIEQAIDRGLSYAPYADLLWCETAKPDLGEAQRFAESIHAEFPGKLLAYNCSPSFNWQANLTEPVLRNFREKACGDGVPLPVHHAGRWHSLNLACSRCPAPTAVTVCTPIRRSSNANSIRKSNGFRAAKHQAFVGTGYFDAVQMTISERSDVDDRDGRQHGK